MQLLKHNYSATLKDGSDDKDIKQARRRLSVMSDNKLVEGFDSVNLDDEEVSVRFPAFLEAMKRLNCVLKGCSGKCSERIYH